MRRPPTRSAGASGPNWGTPRIIASGRAREAAAKAAIMAAGCCPSASIVMAWVKPSAAAARSPCRTAAPLPRLSASRSRRRPGAAAMARSAPSVLPSSTTNTSGQAATASNTVRASTGPVL